MKLREANKSGAVVVVEKRWVDEVWWWLKEEGG